MRFPCLFGGAMILAALSPSRPAAAQSFAATDLGLLAGTSYSYPNTINDASGTIRIVGFTRDKQANWYHGFYWDGSRGMVDMGVVSPGTGSNAIAVNSQGEAVGWASTVSNNANQVPVYRHFGANGPLVRLPVPAGSFGTATAINDSGVIVGTVDSLPVYWQRDTTTNQFVMTALPLPAGSIPTNGVGSMAINADSTIAGWTPSTAVRGNRAMVWHNTSGDPAAPTYTALSMDQAGLPPDDGGDWSFSACGFINSSGTTAGGYGQSGGRFIWTPGSTPVTFTSNKLTGLSDALGGDAVAIGVFAPAYAVTHAFIAHSSTGVVNDLGVLPGGSSSSSNGVAVVGSVFQVVGSSTIKGGASHAFVWTGTSAPGAMTDLNSITSGLSTSAYLSSGDGITARGNIAARGIVKGGYTHAFLLTKK